MPVCLKEPLPVLSSLITSRAEALNENISFHVLVGKSWILCIMSICQHLDFLALYPAFHFLRNLPNWLPEPTQTLSELAAICLQSQHSLCLNFREQLQLQQNYAVSVSTHYELSLTPGYRIHIDILDNVYKLCLLRYNTGWKLVTELHPVAEARNTKLTGLWQQHSVSFMMGQQLHPLHMNGITNLVLFYSRVRLKMSQNSDVTKPTLTCKGWKINLSWGGLFTTALVSIHDKWDQHPVHGRRGCTKKWCL